MDQRVPYTLDDVKTRIVLKAHSGRKLYEPMKAFFHRMQLQWGKTQTAHATRINGIPVIVVSQEFLIAQKATVSEAADIVMHEIMHHLLQHLNVWQQLCEEHGEHYVHIAMDAMCNAYLSEAGFYEFFLRYYPDQDYYSLLKRGSVRFQVRVSYMAGFRQKWVDMDAVDSRKYDRVNRFYRQLYNLQHDLDEVIRFVKTEYPLPPGTPQKGEQQQMLGDPSGKQGGVSDTQTGNPLTSERKNQTSQSPQRSQRDESRKLFAGDEAEMILNKAGLGASRQVRNNFAQIRKFITQTTARSGGFASQSRKSRKLPNKPNGRDLLNIEREFPVYNRRDHRQQKTVIAPDISGSMDAYLTFCQDLVRDMTKRGVDVEVVVWASGVQKCPVSNFLAGELPEVGGGTSGEELARLVARERYSQVIIITDDVAGELLTQVTAEVHLCLIKGAATSGTFNNKTKVPKMYVWQLEP